jgi:hypothetical protein
MRGRAFLDIVPLLSSTETEASIRTQIGRIYYAAYLETRVWCENHLGYQRIRLGREHTEVPKLITSLNAGIVDDLVFLRTYRNTADYDLHISLETLELQLADALDRAATVIATLDGLVPPPSNDGKPL